MSTGPGRSLSTESSLEFDFGMDSSVMGDDSGTSFADSLLSSFGLASSSTSPTPTLPLRPSSMSAIPTTTTSSMPAITRVGSTKPTTTTTTTTSSSGSSGTLRSSILPSTFPLARGTSGITSSSGSIDYLQRPFSSAANSAANSASNNAINNAISSSNRSGGSRASNSNSSNSNNNSNSSHGGGASVAATGIATASRPLSASSAQPSTVASERTSATTIARAPSNTKSDSSNRHSPDRDSLESLLQKERMLQHQEKLLRTTSPQPMQQSPPMQASASATAVAAASSTGSRSPKPTRQRPSSAIESTSLNSLAASMASPTTTPAVPPASPQNRFSASFTGRSSAASAFSAIIDSRRTSATVKDTAVAMDFEKMLNTRETKKLTSTPERMRHIEVKKAQTAPLIAKDPTFRKDESISNMLRAGSSKASIISDMDSVFNDDFAMEGISAPKKSETYWEFLRNTGPEDQSAPKYFPQKATTSALASTTTRQQLVSPPSSPSAATTPSLNAAAQALQRMTSLKELEFGDDSDDLLINGHKKKGGKDMTFSEFLRADPPTSRSASTTPSQTVKKSGGFRLFRSSKTNLLSSSQSSSQSSLQSNSQPVAETAPLLSQKATNSSGASSRLPATTYKETDKATPAAPSIRSSFSDTASLQSSDRTLSNVQTKIAASNMLPSSPGTDKLTLSSPLSTGNTGKRNSRLSTGATESLKGSEHERGASDESLLDSASLVGRQDSKKQNANLSMHQVVLGLGELDKDFASVLGDFNDWSNFGSSAFKDNEPLPYMTVPGQMYHPPGGHARRASGLSRGSNDRLDQGLKATGYYAPPPVAPVRYDDRSSQTTDMRPSITETGAQTDAVVPPPAAVIPLPTAPVEMASTSVQTLEVKHISVSTSPHMPIAKLLFLQHPNNAESPFYTAADAAQQAAEQANSVDQSVNTGPCLSCADHTEILLESHAATLAQHAIDAALKSIMGRYTSTDDMTDMSTQYNLEEDAPQFVPAPPAPIIQENPINMALVDENLRIQQEVATLRLALAAERSKSQHMLILKEASEARFEQLARVAHRKLLSAVGDKQKLQEQRRREEEAHDKLEQEKRERSKQEQRQQQQEAQRQLEHEDMLLQEQQQRRLQQQQQFQHQLLEKKMQEEQQQHHQSQQRGNHSYCKNRLLMRKPH
ncbi:hypothetical protein BSLG_010525 [Batrachochytrium salamandrivorans]|nr:hypothetical protein BSLG_010525 [Batrachochytrium salamandrivorans]